MKKMKKKELKNLAKRVAQAEINIQNNIDVEKNKELIMHLTGQLDWQDLDQFEEFIQEFLKN